MRSDREPPSSLPRVPETDGSVPFVGSPVSDVYDHERDHDPVVYRYASPDGDDSSGGDCCDGGCVCGSAHAEQSDRSPPRTATVADGGTTPTNVDSDGDLGAIEFTPPAENTSQDLTTGAPDERVGVPDGVTLDTPGYGIRSEMNDIETPDEKTWFMELDEAIIQSDRCIQCGTCVAACSSDSIGIGEDGLPKLVKMCTGCSLCWDFCPGVDFGMNVNGRSRAVKTT